MVLPKPKPSTACGLALLVPKISQLRNHTMYLPLPAASRQPTFHSGASISQRNTPSFPKWKNCSVKGSIFIPVTLVPTSPISKPVSQHTQSSPASRNSISYSDNPHLRPRLRRIYVRRPSLINFLARMETLSWVWRRIPGKVQVCSLYWVTFLSVWLLGQWFQCSLRLWPTVGPQQSQLYYHTRAKLFVMRRQLRVRALEHVCVRLEVRFLRARQGRSSFLSLPNLGPSYY